MKTKMEIDVLTNAASLNTIFKKSFQIYLLTNESNDLRERSFLELCFYAKSCSAVFDV